MQLSPGEVVLGLSGVGAPNQPHADVVLTSLGVWFLGKVVKGSGDALHPDQRIGFIPYTDLPANPTPTGWPTRKILLGPGLPSIPVAAGGAARDYLCRFLTDARGIARGETVPAALSPEASHQALVEFSALAEQSHQLRSDVLEARSFALKMQTASRSIVTPLVVLACFAVFAISAFRGVSPFEPTIESLLEWGANFGPAVLLDHEYWRAFTAMFLHVGLFHILMNMFALATVGPKVERIFGHVGFAVLYLFSGLAGSLASLWFHPMIVSAGASGAIFGVFGGLVGMLVAVRNEAPLMVLKPMARGLTAFLGYNLVFGLTVPNIDMSAHLGGLVMGIISGFVLTLSAKAPARLRPFARVLAIGGLLAVLMGAGVFATRAGVTRMRNQPEFVEYKAAPEFNAFIQSVKPLLVEFDHIQRQAGNTLADGRILPGEFSVLQSIAAASTSLNARLARVTPENADLETLKASLATMFQNQKNAIDQLLNFARTGDANHMEGQGGYLACQNAIQAAINEFQARRDQYLQKYKLTAQSK